MLVLSRHKNETIVLGDDIAIVVVELRGDKVRLGIENPKHIPVHRREVYDAIRRNEASNEEYKQQHVTVMLSEKAQEAVKKLTAGVEGSSSPNVLLEQILLKAAHMD